MRAWFAPLFLAAVLVMPVRAEDEKVPPTESTEDAMAAIKSAVEKTEKKRYKTDGSLDVEVGGSPMMTAEITGAHVGDVTHNVFNMEMMGQKQEAWTKGDVVVAKNPQTGAWEKQAGGASRTSMGPAQALEMVKSPKFIKDSKVGSHECRVVKGKLDGDKMKKLMGRGMGGGDAKVKGSDVRFYIDKKDGRLRRVKMELELSANMQGQAMEFATVFDFKYKYDSKLELKIPADVQAVFDGKEPKESDDDEDEEMEENDEKEEGSSGGR